MKMKVDLQLKNISSYRKYFNDGLLLDNGPLMLIFYGEYDKINGTNYLKKIDYQKYHFDALIRFISGVPTNKLIITPHIFHELWKHSQKDFDDKLKDFFNLAFNKLINMKERHTNKEDMLNHDLFIKLEIGEHSLVCACNDQTCKTKNPHALLHDDRKLCGILRKDNDILTINLKKDIIPWYWTTK